MRWRLLPHWGQNRYQQNCQRSLQTTFTIISSKYHQALTAGTLHPSPQTAPSRSSAPQPTPQAFLNVQYYPTRHHINGLRQPPVRVIEVLLKMPADADTRLRRAFMPMYGRHRPERKACKTILPEDVHQPRGFIRPVLDFNDDRAAL